MKLYEVTPPPPPLSLPLLTIVIPCYNEEEVLQQTVLLFLKKLTDLVKNQIISEESRILFVDDGSSDKTWEIIKYYNSLDRHITGIQQSRNRGHQNAIWAGMMESKNSDIIITIDCDGQDDINAIDLMIEKYKDGYDIVYGVRKNRKKDSLFKKNTALFFYRFIRNMSDVEIVYNHADYRLLSKRTVMALSNFREVNLFLRGIIPLIGFKKSTVYYDREERIAGESHYPLQKMVKLAIDGITSFSVKPLYFISAVGFFISIISFVFLIWALIKGFFREAIAGWASLISIICFVSGIQLLSIGILGIYVGKIYTEVKDRPRYILSDKIGI